ncbi:acyltransferase [Citrobacter koseri]|uniref:acyltransferase family protein n=1 Tax=Citrobacter koseri TaxID=545 RepID=UPI00190474C8|nr:acyltransferase [Citrobacter koseri]MBJ9171578.1 acyltransferase [Citrobacter koseri]HEM6670374.1 acyltransferase [Citrobacter koseri]
MVTTNNKTINSIQILRGLAALSVVLYHYGFYLVPDGGNISNRFFSWGGIGVDLFFVISGFIMIIITNHSEPGFNTSKRFIINRLSRILPVYYVILFITFLTGGAMSTFHYSEKVSNLISAITFTPYMHETAPMYILSNGMFNIRWTLNFELYFYFAFALCLLCKNKLLPLLTWFLAPLLLCFLITGDITFSTKGYNFNNAYIELITNPIILEFGFGVLTGLLYLHLKKKNYSPHILISLFIIAAITLGVSTKVLTMYNLLTGIAFSVLVLALSLSDHFFSKAWSKKLVYLGNISFSLYLIHNPLANFISKKVEKYIDNGMHNTFGVIIMLVAAILAAHISHKYLEIRLSKLTKSWLESVFFRKSILTKPL